jgi:regulatory protein
MRAIRVKAPASIRSTAIRLLARREYARAELAMRLRQRGADPDEVEQTLDELERLGYLSDARSAEALVRQRAGHLGSRAIAANLRERGIGADDANDALQSLAERDELADAQALWSRRFGRPPTDDRDKARQLRFIVARGYSLSIAFKVLKAAGTACDDD